MKTKSEDGITSHRVRCLSGLQHKVPPLLSYWYGVVGYVIESLLFFLFFADSPGREVKGAPQFSY